MWLALNAWVTVPGRDLQRGEQVDDAVAPVVVRVPHRATRPQRERQLGPFQRLDGCLLVDTEHDGVFGRVEVEPDDIGHPRGKGRVSAHFIGAREVRLDTVGAQHVGYAAAGPPTATPSKRVVHRLRPAGGGESASCTIWSTVADGSAWSRRPAFGWSCTPSTPSRTKRRRMRDTASGEQVEPGRNLRGGETGRAEENDAGTTDDARGGRRTNHERFQDVLLFTRRCDAVRPGHACELDHMFDHISTAVH